MAIDLRTDVGTLFSDRRLRPVRTLVLHRPVTRGNVLGHLAAPLVHTAQSPDCRLPLTLLETSSDESRLRRIAETRPDVVVDFRDWWEPCDRIAEFIDRVREASPHSAYVLMDGADQAVSRHLPLIEHVDVYAKGQILADPAEYATDHLGGSPFTDFIARSLGIDLEGWHFGARVDGAVAARMHLSWNIGTLRRGSHLAAAMARMPGRSRRPIGLHLRIGRGGEGWYERLRDWSTSTAAAAAAATGVRTTETAPITRRRYLAELAASRIVFSPFGWGELCFRDFEAASFGAVLLKPDVGHLRTRPNIFEPMRTYVPVRWDLADLGERIAWIESHPDEADSIARRATTRLRDWFRGGHAVHAVEELVVRASSARPGHPAMPQGSSTHAITTPALSRR
ncbi:MAG: glycosyltransferase family protein [Planctomycetota bacterium]|jgi:hypothetical protein